MKIRFDGIHLAVLLLCFPGYPLMVGIINIIGMSGNASSTASMAMRALTVALAILLILRLLGRNFNGRPNYVILLLATFWIELLPNRWTDFALD